MNDCLRDLDFIFEKRVGDNSASKLFSIHSKEKTIIEKQFPFIKVIKENLKTAHVVFYDERNQVNAFSAIVKGTPVIGIYTGTILKIVDVIKLKFINFNNADKTVSINNTTNQSNVKSIITLNNYTNKARIDFDNNKNIIIDYNWGNLDKSTITQCEIILNLALNFIVFHEIGHIMEGHLTTRKDNTNFLNMSSDYINETVELEADIYAYDKLYEQLDIISTIIYETIKIKESEKYPIAITYIVEIIALTLFLLRPVASGEYLSLGVRAMGCIVNFRFLLQKEQKLRNSFTKEWIETNDREFIKSFALGRFTDCQNVDEYIERLFDEHGKITSFGLNQYLVIHKIGMLHTCCTILGDTNWTYRFQLDEYLKFFNKSFRRAAKKEKNSISKKKEIAT